MWPFKGNKRQNRLIFSSPAKQMECSLPVGCYDDGAFVMGGVGEECIKILHLNSNMTHSSTFEQDLLEKIDGEKNVSTIKKELSKGNISIAEKIIKNSFSQAGIDGTDVSMVSFCKIGICYHIKNPVRDYRRVLDLSTGLMTVSFADKQGVTFRDCFMSSEKIFCYRYYCDSENKECDVILSCEGESNVYSKDNFLILKKQNAEHIFACVIMAESESGGVSGINNKLKIKNSKMFCLYAKAFDCESKDYDLYVKKIMAELKAGSKKFDLMYKATAGKLSKVMGKCKIEFSEKEIEDVDSELLRQKSHMISPQMIDALYKYGKYLSYALGGVAMATDDIFGKKCVCETLPEKCEIMNFQKVTRIFCLDILSCSHANISTFFENLYEKISVYEKNASKIYGVDGVFIPCKQDIVGFPKSVENVNVLNKNYTFLIGVLCKCFIDYFDKNSKNIEKITQILQKIANFYENFLINDENKGVYSSPFGISPYSFVDSECHMIARDCVTDFECAKYIFQSMLDLGIEEDLYKGLIDKIPDVVVDSSGVIKEFNGLQKYMPQSKSLSHLVPYSIGIRPFKSKPEYEDLVSSSVKSRFVGCFGCLCSRDLVDMALALSCCSNGVDSMEILSLLIKTFIKENLLFSHYDLSNTAVGKWSQNDFINIDVNTALSTCLQNIVASYKNGVLYLSNDYPKCFNAVKGYGLLLSKNLICNIKINREKGIIKVGLVSTVNDVVTIMLPHSYKRIRGTKKSIDRVDMSIKDIYLIKNKPLRLTIFF